MENLYILTDSTGKVIYQGEDEESCRSHKSPDVSKSFTEYHFGDKGDLYIWTTEWVHNSVVPGKFKNTNEGRSFHIPKSCLEGLLMFLQSQLQNPPNSPPSKSP